MVCQPPASILYGGLKKQIALPLHMLRAHTFISLSITRTQTQDTLFIYGA